MPDVFFKCEACGRHFVADAAGAGIIINCPDCNTLATIPEIANPGNCPRCQYELSYSPKMQGESVHCPGCRGEVRL